MNPNKNIIKNEKIMKRSYENAVVDIMLLILLIAVTVSGVKLHVLISHGHTDLHTWIIIHVICGLAMLTTILLHIRYHWKSYISRKTLRGKITFLLSFVFGFVVITGLVLLLVISGTDTKLGLVHYVSGLVMIAFALGHLIRRRKIFVKFVKEMIASVVTR